MQHRTLEVTCYVAGAGAFGVFIRWLQDQLAFNDEGLAERSWFHLIVVLYILAMAFVFLRFVNRERDRRRSLPEGFCQALANPGRLYAVLRWAAGGVVCLGALLLFSASELDEDVMLLRVLAAVALAFGLSYPWLLSLANKPPLKHRGLLCLVSMLPVLLFAIWLIVCYKENAINSVAWSYAIEFVTIVAAMAAFFRLAGFCFDAAKPWRCMFTCMFGCGMCVMSLADERYMGMHLIFLGCAAFLLLCNWLMFSHLQKGSPVPKPQPDDGFERLDGIYVPPEDPTEED